ncbi:MAG TPA: type II secretion system protein [Gammaproteobacteria bacterium]
MTPRFARRSCGFTFVELVISIVVIGIAVTGVLLVYTTTVASSADPMIRQQALAVAQAYLDEAVSKSYDDPDGADGEVARTDFDDVDDYDALDNVAASLPDGSSAGLDAYIVTVDVTNAVLNGVNMKRVEVEVRGPAGIRVTLASHRAQY